jgi:protein tyrosine/serine phosphatase
MDTPARPADDPVLPRPTRRAWLGLGARAAFAGLLAAAAAEIGSVFVGGNFHTVLPGQFYRCAQPSPERLRQLIRDHGIRTVVNLRGPGPSFDWYRNECRTAEAFDACQEDLWFSAGRLPSVPEVRRLVEVLDRSERPLLFHCQRGADRTGLAAAVALLLYGDVSYAEARRQLGPRYGHVRVGRPGNLDRFFDLYRDWLRRQGLAHSRANFRRWVVYDYCPGACRAVLEPLDLPRAVPAGEPFGARVRFHNTSVKPWRFRPGTTAGVHACFVVSDARASVVTLARAGMFDAEVAPGESIDLTLPVPALRRPGRYTLTVDLFEEQHCGFAQVGSEPLEWDFEVLE